MTQPTSVVLSVNAGSSSLKFALYPAHHEVLEKAVLSGCIDGLSSDKELVISWNDNLNQYSEILRVEEEQPPYETALEALLRILNKYIKNISLIGIAHRVVHGGSKFDHSVIVNSLIYEYLETLCELAPLHQPHNLLGIKIFSKYFPNLPQVACFDTAFHHNTPKIERNFALPLEMADEGILRYGFHGLSYEYVSQKLNKLTSKAKKRFIMAHLGGGASLCACLNLHSKATTMGFSTADGLMMGSRCGNLDPGVLLYLMNRGWTHKELQTLLYSKSGLKGVSQISSDMRYLRSLDNPSAQFAIDMFSYRAIREFGALSACIGGIDVIAFTGGIGEHDVLTRATICNGLRYLGVILDMEANELFTNGCIRPIHSTNSSVEIWVIPADEGRVAAKHAITLIGNPC